MPPQIALTLCVLFILFLLRMDSKRKSNVSLAIWIPLIWVMIISSRSPNLWFNPTGIVSPELYAEGNPFNRMFFVILIVAGLFILFKRNLNWSQILRDNTWLFVFILYCAVSILWSDYPLVSFKRWFKAMGNLVMVLIILSETNPFEAVKIIIKRIGYILIPLSIVLIKFYPALGRTYHSHTGELFITGVTTNKNSLGQLCLVCGLTLFCELLSTWRNKEKTITTKTLLQISIFIMILWLLINVDSATSLLCFIIGVCTFIGLEMFLKNKNVQHLNLYVGIIIFSLSIALLISHNIIISSIVNVTGHANTFWGRTLLWQDLIAMSNAPLIGTGYDSFWLGDRIVILWEEYGWHPTQAHNGYVETFIDIGLVGLCLLLIVIFSAYRNIKKRLLSDVEFGKYCMAFLVVVLLFNVMEAAFKGLYLIWFIFLVTVVRYRKLS